MNADKIIYARERGIFPDTGADMTADLSDLFKAATVDTTYIFEPGRYDFSAQNAIKRAYSLSNTTALPVRKLGILLENMHNITVDFTGSELMFAGQMQPLTIDGCSDITVRNFSINWVKPLVGEGIVTGRDENSYTVFVDGKAFPHRFKEGKLLFEAGAGEEYPLFAGSICFDPTDKTVFPGTGDCLSIGKFENLGNGYYKVPVRAGGYIPITGTILSLRHNERWHAGIFAENSKRVKVEDVNVYSCGGLGCLCQFCEDLSFRRIHFTPDINNGRMLTNGHDDGFHITCCRGMTIIEQCSFIGLMDDPINVHGCSVSVTEAIDKKTLRCRFMHEQSQGFKYWARKGDIIALIDKKHMNRITSAVVEDFSPETDGYFTLRFMSEVPCDIPDADSVAADNISATCAVTIRECRFGSCRARGILVSEPKPVLVEDNLFDTSGTAILISGDCNGWYESGACEDVTVRGNVFSDRCLSSNYQFCHGIISICPVIPEPDEKLPFHRNIKIINNTFDTPGQPILYAFSVQGLMFENNRVFRSYRVMPWKAGDKALLLEYCSDILIKNNIFIGFDKKYMEE